MHKVGEMFLQWIEDVGLLEQDPSRGVLKGFPLHVRRQISTTMVGYVGEELRNAALLMSTTTHVEWVFECIGQTFSLPLDETDAMQSAVDVYKHWLFGIQRPTVMAGRVQPFIQDMFKHFSLLFASRETQVSAQKEKHLNLCSQVLDVLLRIGKERSSTLSVETWDILLKLLIGITDFTARSPSGMLELLPSLTKVLLELFLRSGTRSALLWSTLQRFYSMWTNHMCCIVQWIAVGTAFTQRILRILYGPTEGTDDVRVNWMDEVSSDFHVGESQSFFLWTHFLYLIGNPFNIEVPDVFLCATQGIYGISQRLSAVGSRPIEPVKGQRMVRRPHPSDTNTLIELFGSWLFECALREDMKMEKGRAVALTALCGIFCRHTGEDINRSYTSLFLKCLKMGITSNGFFVVEAILLHSTSLFCLEIEGSRILLPHFVNLVGHCLKAGNHDSFQVKHRRAAIKLLGSIICVPGHFLKERENADGSSMRSYFSAIRPRIVECVMDGLASEVDELALQSLLWNAIVLIFEDDTGGRSTLTSFVRLLTQRIASPGQWTDAVMLTSFNALGSLCNLPARSTSSDASTAALIVQTLSRFVVSNLGDYRTEKVIPKERESLLEAAFICISDWCVSHHERLFVQGDLMSDVFRAIDCAILERNDRQDKTGRKYVTTDKISNAAMNSFYTLLNLVPYYPLENQDSRICSVDEDDIMLSEHGMMGVSFYSLNNRTLVSVVEPPVGGSDSARFIVRSAFGKFTWTMGLVEKELDTKSAPTTPFDMEGEEKDSGFEDDTPFVEDKLRQELRRLASDDAVHNLPTMAGSASHSQGLGIAYRVFSDVVNAASAQKPKMFDWCEKFPVEMCPEKPIKSSISKGGQWSRLFLSQMGLLSFSSRETFQRLLSGQKLFRSLKMLDKTSERECHKIGVIYVKKDQEREQDILCNEESDVSDDFSEFLWSLGWPVDLSDHTGFSGGLDRIRQSTGKTAPYWADYRREVIYHVVTQMPTISSDHQQIGKKRHVGNDQIHVVWLEHTRDYRVHTIRSQFNFIHIVIYPLKCGLYRVSVTKKDGLNIPPFGPLQDGMVVEKNLLGHLVRETCINASDAIRRLQKAYHHPHERRSQLIAELVGRCQLREQRSEFYSSYFMTSPPSAPMSSTVANFDRRRRSMTFNRPSLTGSFLPTLSVSGGTGRPIHRTGSNDME